MESLLDRVKADNKRILSEAGAHAPVTFTPPTGADQVVECFYVDVALTGINLQTNAPIIGRKIALTAHLADFVITNPADTVGNWKASFVNNMGETVTGYLENTMPDRTLGMVTMTLHEEEPA